MLKRLKAHHTMAPPVSQVKTHGFPFSQATQASSWHPKPTSPGSFELFKDGFILFEIKNWCQKGCTTWKVDWFICWSLCHLLWVAVASNSPIYFHHRKFHVIVKCRTDLGSRSCWSKSRHVHARFATGCGPGDMNRERFGFQVFPLQFSDCKTGQEVSQRIGWNWVYNIYILVNKYLYI